ncbi:MULTISPECIES: hypothetical protein [unclassified Streptomyces]|uniref:hypothetical protein n=1 Tax=unclassified Streptomyces TaxID=2593676 RepID=UPI002E777064|nr:MULTISPECIES: hypothetical protein [unclassified Streptomyces]MEE1763742.1 hypothetical protein [Streptomyces sp. SP18BB07]MEE1835054.1 hypothetical protein [Streptomyces sp. SP17KL33]
MQPVDVHSNLRSLLNEWDPIGVADQVQDEYDCLIAPLLTRLHAGSGPAVIGEFLGSELEDHFALDPQPQEVDQLANRLVTWWSTGGPA